MFRSCHDSQQEAQVLLLQARLALLAQHWEAAVHLTQVPLHCQWCPALAWTMYTKQGGYTPYLNPGGRHV